MAQTVIELPDELKSLADERAAAAGVSLEEYVRRVVADAVGTKVDVQRRERSDDPLFRDVPVFEGEAPSDGALNHDKYLYDVDPHGNDS